LGYIAFCPRALGIYHDCQLMELIKGLETNCMQSSRRLG
jgi:hypothetical protein